MTPGPAAADVAFCEDVSARGLDAWVEAFDVDGVQLGPGRGAVIGHEAIAELMAPGFDQPGLSFTWRPEHAAVSAAWDLGYTWGRSAYFEDGETTAHGKYLTVWRQTRDGWKLALDTGNLTAFAGEAPPAPPPDPDGPSFELGAGDAPAGRPPYEPLLEAERDFAEDYRAGGADAWAAWFLPGGFELPHLAEPIAGRDAIRAHRAALDARSDATLTWAPVYAEGSASDDLGFTYGGWKLHDGGALAAWGKFAMAWERDDDGAWRVAVDVGHRDGYAR